jgi:hypothetical protein
MTHVESAPSVGPLAIRRFTTVDQGEYDPTLHLYVHQLSADLPSQFYTASLDTRTSIKEMVAAGCYDLKHRDIVDHHFPLQGSPTQDVIVTLVHFNRNLDTYDVLRGLCRLRFRPATIAVLLAIGADENTRDLQCSFPIVGLGSVWRDATGRRKCPYLSSASAGRILDLGRLQSGWSRSCRFAAINM